MIELIALNPAMSKEHLCSGDRNLAVFYRVDVPSPPNLMRRACTYCHHTQSYHLSLLGQRLPTSRSDHRVGYLLRLKSTSGGFNPAKRLPYPIGLSNNRHGYNAGKADGAD